MNYSESLSIPVKVALCKKLAPLLKNDKFVEQFVFETESLLYNLMSDLGISGKAVISVSGDSMLKPVEVFVHDLQLRYPRSIIRSIWEYTSGKELGHLPPDYDAEKWLKDIFRLPENSGPQEDKIDSRTFTKIASTLAMLATSIISRHVEKLLGIDQTTAFLNYGKQFLPPEEQKIIERLAPDQAGRFLKALLKMRISISGADMILPEISNVLKSGLNEAEIEEALICRLCSKKIDIEINPGYLQQILGSYPGAEAISRLFEHAGQKYRDTFNLLNDGIFYELGIRLPDIRFVPNNKLEGNTFALRINHLRTCPVRGLQVFQIMVNESPKYLESLGISPVVPCRNPSNKRENSLVNAEQREELEKHGMITWDAVGYTDGALWGASQGRNPGDFYAVNDQVFPPRNAGSRVPGPACSLLRRAFSQNQSLPQSMDLCQIIPVFVFSSSPVPVSGTRIFEYLPGTTTSGLTKLSSSMTSSVSIYRFPPLQGIGKVIVGTKGHKTLLGQRDTKLNQVSALRADF